MHYGPLERIEFDLEACSKNSVLVTDEQLAVAGHAAAAFQADARSCSAPDEGRELVLRAIR